MRQVLRGAAHALWRAFASPGSNVLVLDAPAMRFPTACTMLVSYRPLAHAVADDIILKPLLLTFLPLRRIHAARHDADDGPVLAAALAVGNQLRII